MKKKLPDFVIIGAQKSATSFLHHCLKEHPEIYLPDSEVPFFEDSDFQKSTVQDLEDLLAPAEPGNVIGIKRPNYLGDVECAQNIHSIVPEAKLIVILRNPLDRAMSAYFHQMSNGLLPVRSVPAGIRNLLDGKYSLKYPRSKQIIGYGFYCTHLKRYLEFFDKGQLLVLYYSEIKSNPQQAIQEVCRFLKVSDEFLPNAITVKPKKRNYSIFSVYLSSIRSKLIYSYNEDMTRLHLKKELSVFYKLFVKIVKIIDSMIPERSLGAVNFPPGLKGRLSLIYQEEINCLEKLLDRDFSIWKD